MTRKLNDSQRDYAQQVDKCIPGLSQSRPDIVQLLASYQVFRSSSNQWLPQLMELCNQNKHDIFTPQERIEGGSITVGSLAWTTDCTDTKINDCFMIGDNGGALVSWDSTTQELEYIPFGVAPQPVHTRWVEFVFPGIEDNVEAFLDKCCIQVGKIVNILKAKC